MLKKKKKTRIQQIKLLIIYIFLSMCNLLLLNVKFHVCQFNMHYNKYLLFFLNKKINISFLIKKYANLQFF